MRQHAGSCATVAGNSGPSLLPPASSERRGGGRREGAWGGAQQGWLGNFQTVMTTRSVPARPYALACAGADTARAAARAALQAAPPSTILNPAPSTLNPTLDAPMLCERPTREVDWGRCDCSACSRVRACIPVALRVRTLVQVKLPCRTEHTNTSGDDAES